MFQNVNVANNSPIEIIANHEYRLFLTRYSIITYIESEKLATNGLTPVPLKDIPSLENNATHSLGQIFILRHSHIISIYLILYFMAFSLYLRCGWIGNCNFFLNNLFQTWKTCEENLLRTDQWHVIILIIYCIFLFFDTFNFYVLPTYSIIYNMQGGMRFIIWMCWYYLTILC